MHLRQFQVFIDTSVWLMEPYSFIRVLNDIQQVWVVKNAGCKWLIVVLDRLLGPSQEVDLVFDFLGFLAFADTKSFKMVSSGHRARQLTALHQWLNSTRVKICDVMLNVVIRHPLNLSHKFETLRIVQVALGRDFPQLLVFGRNWFIGPGVVDASHVHYLLLLLARNNNWRFWSVLLDIDLGPWLLAQGSGVKKLWFVFFMSNTGYALGLDYCSSYSFTIWVGSVVMILIDLRRVVNVRSWYLIWFIARVFINWVKGLDVLKCSSVDALARLWVDLTGLNSKRLLVVYWSLWHDLGCMRWLAFSLLPLHAGLKGVWLAAVLLLVNIATWWAHHPRRILQSRIWGSIWSLWLNHICRLHSLVKAQLLFFFLLLLELKFMFLKLFINAGVKSFVLFFLNDVSLRLLMNHLILLILYRNPRRIDAVFLDLRGVGNQVRFKRHLIVWLTILHSKSLLNLGRLSPKLGLDDLVFGAFNIVYLVNLAALDRLGDSSLI